MKGLKEIECIFVDYFDTVVYRKIFPDQTKIIWAKKLSEKIDYLFDAEEILKLRLQAENYFSQRTSANGQFSYGEICEFIYGILKIKFGFSFCNQEDFFSLAKSAEESVEIECQFLNEKLVEFLFSQKRNGKKIFLVSDFYLGKDSYEKFFDVLGISGLFDKIYVSCDVHAAKYNGSLYKKILAENNLDAKKILMMGDNVHSDFKIPRSLSMNAKISVNRKQRARYKKMHDDFCGNRALRQKFQTIFKTKNPFSNYAFSLYLFCSSLYEKCIREKIRTLFFLSREGEFLKKLFDEFLLSEPRKIRTEYFYASRNSTLLPSLENLDKENFNIIFRQYDDFSMHSFFKAICLDDDEIEKIGAKEIHKVIFDFKNSREFSELKRNENFISIYDSKRKQQNANFKNYLKKTGWDGKSKIHLVDVGWKGSMQDNIFKIFGGKICVEGIYLGFSGFGNFSEENQKSGVLFDLTTHRDCSASDIFRLDSFYYEYILTASHGKTVGYDSALNPVLQNDEAVTEYNLYIEKVQEGIFKKFKEIEKCFGGFIVEKNQIPLFEEMHEKMIYMRSICEWGILFDIWNSRKDSFVTAEPVFVNEGGGVAKEFSVTPLHRKIVA